MFNPQVYENSRPDGIGVLEIAGGPVGDEPRPRTFVPLRQTDLEGELAGPLASLRLVQTFGFSGTEDDRVIEALYRFPLPGDAVVTAVRVRFGAVEIRAALKERGSAEADYQQARQEGRQAALLTRESPDVFTLSVAGIRPGQDVTVETSYVQLARAEGSGWSLRIPLTTAPRYVRGDELGTRHAQGQPLALLRDPGHRFSLDLAVSGGIAITSPTHRLEVAREGNRQRVRLQGGEVVPDRDCVLGWKPAQQGDRPTLQVWLHDDRASGQVYFLALAAPPATHDRGRGTPREVVLLVDHSGSMEGAKWQAADWAVERFLSDLSERDVFFLGLFHNTTRWLSDEPRRATPEAVQEAVRFLREARDSGGTELGVALEQSLDRQRSQGEFSRHVLVITDAEVSDFGRILRLAAEESRRADRRRISVLCIDAAPNSLLANELAEQGGGVARFLTSEPQEEDVATALDEVMADWGEPVLAGLRLAVDRPRVEAAGREVFARSQAGWSAIDLGDLPAGRPAWAAGRVPRGEADELAFRLRLAGGHELVGCRLDLRDADARPALKALFGARRVRGLEWLLHSGLAGDELRDRLRSLGYDPEAVLAGQPKKKARVYAENARADIEAALRSLLVREALDYGLPSSETAFVATRTEEGKPIQETVVVANALPSGWSGRFIGGVGAGGSAHAGALFCAMAAAPPLSFAKTIVTKSKLLSGGAMPERAAPEAPATVVFRGVPTFVGGEAILFDSTAEAGAGLLPERGTIVRLEVRFPDRAPAAGSLDAGLCLLIFADDLASPRARVRLADLVRQRGERPLNLARSPGQVLRLVLVDPAETWKTGAPTIEVALACQAQ